MPVSQDSQSLLNHVIVFFFAGGQNVQELFTSSLSTHAVEQVLKVVPLEKSEEFYHLYLHDFVSHLSLHIEDTNNGYKVTRNSY